MENKLRKIIWAVDVFEEPGRLQQNAVQMLQSLTRKPHRGKVEIEPVFVLQEQITGPALEFSPVWLAQYRTAAEVSARDMLKKVSLKGLKEPQILNHPSSSTHAAAVTLINYALKEKADLIVTNTHSKRGLKRMLLGSFAENLLIHSPVPVLTVGPHLHKLPAMKNVLFPSEFSEHSFSIFKRVAEQARRMNMGVVIYHAIPYPVRPYLSANVMYPSTYWNMLQDYLKRERTRTKNVISHWTEWAKARHIPVKAIVDEESGSIWESILDSAEKNKVGLIALEAQSGPFSAALAGSTVRHVVRNASSSVWILSSRYAKSHIKKLRREGLQAIERPRTSNVRRIA